MLTEHFEQGPIRPPDEADSLLIRTTRGCPWNRCAFCTLYKGHNFSIRSVEDIKKDILAAKATYGKRLVERCFLQDGDSFTMETADLLEVLRALKEAFPTLKRISSYGRAQTLMKKSAQEMQEIGDAGLNVLYCGMESGSDAVLRKMRKGTSRKHLLASSKMAKDAGMDILLFTILGLGGKELTDEHADDTASLINAIDPAVIRILTLAVKPGTRLHEMEQAGNFNRLTESEMVAEQRRIVSQLDGISSSYMNFHAVNLLTEMRGELPQDKPKLLDTLDRFLNLPPEAQLNFVFGRRSGHYSRLDDMTGNCLDTVSRLMKSRSPDELEDYFHDCRRHWI